MAKQWFLCAILISFCVSTNSDCSYLDARTGFGFPTDACVYRTTATSPNSSTLFHCASSGIEIHQFNNYNCDGNSSTLTDTEWDYQCGVNNSPKQCNAATLIFTSCDGNGTIYRNEIIIIVNKCFNAQNSSFMAQCDGYNNGYIFRYNSLDCQGFGMNTENIFGMNTENPYCNPQLIWQCNTFLTDQNDANNTDRNITHSVITYIQNIQWTAQMIAVCLAAILICLLLTIICVYCACCKSKRINKEDQAPNDHYVPMQNMPKMHYSAPLVSNAQVLQYANIIPSAPKMSSVNNEDCVGLAYGWNKAITDDGKVYYQNNITKKTQWQNPDLKRVKTNGIEGGGAINLLNDKEYEGVVNFFNERVCIADDEDTHKYIKFFVLNGYDSAYKISQITDQQLIGIGIQNISHRQKILFQASQI